MALFCIFGASARKLPFDAKHGSNCFFERLCSFVDYEVRALGDKHRAVMLVIDDGVPFADGESSGWWFCDAYGWKLLSGEEWGQT